MIMAGQFKELYQATFKQKLEKGDETTYTSPLTDEEERLMVEQLLRGQSVWKSFLIKYVGHYALCNKSVSLLIAKITEGASREILLENFKRYGFNEEQGMAISGIADMLDAEFLQTFCESGRILFKDLYARLSLNAPEKYQELCKQKGLPTDGSWGELYKQAVIKRRKS